MIDGTAHVELRDLEIAHDADAGDVQQLFILFLLRIRQREIRAALRQGPVIRPGRRPHLLVLRFVQVGHILRIRADGPAGVEGVPVVTDGGIQQQ